MRSTLRLAALAAVSLSFAAACDEAAQIVSGDTDIDTDRELDTDIDPIDLIDDLIDTSDRDRDADADADADGTLAVGACNTDAQCNAARNEKCVEGVCVGEPRTNAQLWDEVKEWDNDKQKFDKRYVVIDGQTPDTSCRNAAFPEVRRPRAEWPNHSTNLLGVIRVFGLDAQCSTLYVDLFTENLDDGTPSEPHCTSRPNAGAEACPAGGNPAWIGGARVTSVEVQVTPEAKENRCFVFFKNVPTDRWLVFRATNNSGEVFKVTYQFNSMVRDADKVTDAKQGYKVEVNAISSDSYQLIPATAGVSGGVADDRGAIAGTVRDCQGRRLKFGTVGLTGETEAFSYFNANANNLLPLNGQSSTNDDATYGSVSHEEGTWKVVAQIRSGGEVITARPFSAFVKRNSVSIVAFRLGNPINYPPADATLFPANLPDTLFGP